MHSDSGSAIAQIVAQLCAPAAIERGSRSGGVRFTIRPQLVSGRFTYEKRVSPVGFSTVVFYG
jgi:hypothetical protein